MPEAEDHFEIELVSSFGEHPLLPAHIQALVDDNILCLVLRVNGFYTNACALETSPPVLSTKSFVGNIGLLDSFVKNIILYLRVQKQKPHIIRFFSNDATELQIMENLEIRYDENNVVSRRKLNGPLYENGEMYYGYGTIVTTPNPSPPVVNFQTGPMQLGVGGSSRSNTFQSQSSTSTRSATRRGPEGGQRSSSSTSASNGKKRTHEHVKEGVSHLGASISSGDNHGAVKKKPGRPPNTLKAAEKAEADKHKQAKLGLKKTGAEEEEEEEEEDREEEEEGGGEEDSTIG